MGSANLGIGLPWDQLNMVPAMSTKPDFTAEQVTAEQALAPKSYFLSSKVSFRFSTLYSPLDLSYFIRQK